MDRDRLILLLNAVTPIQLNEIIFAVEMPLAEQPSASAVHGERVFALLNWAGSLNGCGLKRIEALLGRNADGKSRMSAGAAKRLEEIDKLLADLYEKRAFFEQELIITADVERKFEIKKKLERGVLVEIQKYEAERLRYFTPTPIQIDPEPAPPVNPPEPIQPSIQSAETVADTPAPLAGELKPGEIFEGKYEIVRRIGHGGFGVVYQARHIELGYFVAVKVLDSKLAADAEYVERFRREAQAMARVFHPNIVRVIDQVARNGMCHIVMEYLEGETLRDRLDRSKRMAVEEAVRIIEQVCSALERMHGEDIVHRDLKPDNLFLHRVKGVGETVKVLDFGIARQTGNRMTKTGMMLGTPHYMSPEQCQGEVVDGRSDLYSLGIVFYELLAGRVPFHSDAPYALLMKHVTEPPPPITNFTSNVHLGITAVVQKVLAKKPEERYQTAEEFAKALRESLENAEAPTPIRLEIVKPQLPPTFTNGIGMEFVLIPAGEFLMGSTESEREKPVRKVTIEQPFYLGKFQVTQGQWQLVMGSNPSWFKGDDRLPVEQVSWDNCQEFLKRLKGLNDGYVYRLPSEAEWEYACRAGTTGEYGGTGNLDEMGWYWNNSERKTHPVGWKKPNAWGLHDMHGNVSEWCQDWWHENDEGALDDGILWKIGVDNERVMRGGSWSGIAGKCRSAYRGGVASDDQYNYLGFRVLAARTK